MTQCSSCGGDCGRTKKTGCRYGMRPITEYRLPEWSEQDDLAGLVPSEIRQALRQAYQQGREDMKAECLTTTE